jgi:hypothetical protein
VRWISDDSATYSGWNLECDLQIHPDPRLHGLRLWPLLGHSRCKLVVGLHTLPNRPHCIRSVVRCMPAGILPLRRRAVGVCCVWGREVLSGPCGQLVGNLRQLSARFLHRHAGSVGMLHTSKRAVLL